LLNKLPAWEQNVAKTEIFQIEISELQILFLPRGMTAGKQLALVKAHCILGYYFSSAPVPFVEGKM